MILLVPTMNALQDLISVCEVYAAKHEIIYNNTKTEYSSVRGSLHTHMWIYAAEVAGPFLCVQCASCPVYVLACFIYILYTVLPVFFCCFTCYTYGFIRN